MGSCFLFNLSIREEFYVKLLTRHSHSPSIFSWFGGFQPVAFDEEKVSSTAKKIYSRKIQELAGNDIFRGDSLHWSAEKQLSTAKLKEMSGSNIFANGNGKTVTRDYLGGVRKPPGGGSSFAFA